MKLGDESDGMQNLGAELSSLRRGISMGPTTMSTGGIIGSKANGDGISGDPKAVVRTVTFRSGLLA